jgi:hypothetical protein
MTLGYKIFQNEHFSVYREIDGQTVEVWVNDEYFISRGSLFELFRFLDAEGKVKPSLESAGKPCSVRLRGNDQSW